MADMTFRALGRRLLDTLPAYLDKLPQQPAYRPLPTEVWQELERMEIPVDGVTPKQVIESFLRLVLPYGRGQNYPYFAAFVDPAASKLSVPAAFTEGQGSGRN